MTASSSLAAKAAAPSPSSGPDQSAHEYAGAVLHVDLSAIAANYRLLGRETGGARVSAVVKADGYGLGAVAVSQALFEAGCDFFYVGHLEEALELRASGHPGLARAEIAVLNGLMPGTEGAYLEHRLLPVLNTLAQVEAWHAFAALQGTRPPALIHLDTGMNRLGLEPGELEVLAGDPGRMAAFECPYLLSHLACADTPDHPKNAEQASRLREALARLPIERASLANSAGCFLGPDHRFDMVRPGYALYGGNPVPERANPMKPALRLAAQVLQVRSIDTPDTVGYGASYAAAGPRRIATLCAGYADGLFRALSEGGAAGAFAACVDGHRLPVLGRVSMDLVSVDVTDAPEDLVRPGGWVDLIGAHCDIDAVGQAAGTVGYEVLTSLGARYARRYEADTGRSVV